MSPFVMISYNGWESNTEVVYRAGMNAEWRQACNFNYSANCQDITFTIFDKETFKNDDLIGMNTFKLSQIMGSQTIQLNFEGELAA